MGRRYDFFIQKRPCRAGHIQTKGLTLRAKSGQSGIRQKTRFENSGPAFLQNRRMNTTESLLDFFAEKFVKRFRKK